jgi:hypothetical protein
MQEHFIDWVTDIFQEFADVHIPKGQKQHRIQHQKKCPVAMPFPLLHRFKQGAL